MLQKIKERILAGGEITPDEALELAAKSHSFGPIYCCRRNP